jgi:hypothetical protein
VSAEVQDIIDDLAELLGRPVSLEDRRWRLLAYSAYTDPGDRVRQASILARAAPPEVVEWLEGLDLPAADALVDTAPNPEIGIGPRTCAPVRHGGVLLAFLWVIPGAAPLDEGERTAVVDAATAVATTLWRRRASAAEEHETVGRLLGALLDAEDPEERRAAADELRGRRGWDRDPGCVVAVATVAPGSGDEPADAGARAERRWHAGDLLWRQSADRLVVLVRTPSGYADGALAGTLARAGAAHAGEARSPSLLRARRARSDAEDALVVCSARPELGPTAAWSTLGAWPLAARLWVADGRPPRPDLLGPLLSRRDGPELAAAVEATLERAGDVAAAAADLHVHRATLYRRLARAEEVTGLGLGRGDDVLRLGMALKAWRLAGSTPGGADGD